MGLPAEHQFGGEKILLGVDTDGIYIGGLDVDRDAVLEEAELFESLSALQLAIGQAGELIQGVCTVGIEADVFPEARMAVIPVEGDRGAGEVEGAAVERGNDLDYVGVIDAFWRAGDPQGGDVDVSAEEGTKQGRQVLRLEERLVTLDVDVDVRGDLFGYSLDAIRSAGEIGRGHAKGPAAFQAEVRNLAGVGRDDGGIESGAPNRCFVDPFEHWSACDAAKHLLRKTGGREPRRNDAEHALGGLFG